MRVGASEMHWAFLRRPKGSLSSRGKPWRVRKPSCLSLPFSPERWQAVLYIACTPMQSCHWWRVQGREVVSFALSPFFRIWSCQRPLQPLTMLTVFCLSCPKTCCLVRRHYKPSCFLTPFLMRKIKHRQQTTQTTALVRNYVEVAKGRSARWFGSPDSLCTT